MKTKPDIEQVNPCYYRVFYKGRIYDINEDKMTNNWLIKDRESAIVVTNLNEALAWLNLMK